MITTLTLKEFDKNNRLRLRKDLKKYHEKLIKDFEKFIIKRTDKYKKQIEFNKGALFKDLYEGAISELQALNEWAINVNDIFTDPDSELKQALRVYRSW